jgi:hypothetical protein
MAPTVQFELPWAEGMDEGAFVPDITVIPSLEDQLKNRDVLLERALAEAKF